MPSAAGVRGSTRRKLFLGGIFALGVAVLALVGYGAELSVKQVYWAVYSRLHPMRDGSESYQFSQHSATDRRKDLESQARDSLAHAVTSNSQGLGIVDDSVDKGTAAAAAVAKGEKNVVALLPTEKEQIRHRAHEQTAAREAHQREAEVAEAQEHKHVQDLAEQQLAKATAAYSAEIAAVAGPAEADRLQDKLRKQAVEGRTKLEQEAAASTGKSAGRKALRR